MKKLVTVIIFILASYSCVEEFDLESQSYDKVLVVDALLTNEYKNHYVKATYTEPINSDLSEQEYFLTNARVYVEDSDGNRINYQEKENGYYESDVAYKAEFNREYQLFIITQEGVTYTSSIVNSKKPIDISLVYPEFKALPSNDLTSPEPGIQFYVNSFFDKSDQQYFRYEWEETYKINVPFPSLYDYDYDTQSFFEREESVAECYKTNYSNDIIIANSALNQNNQIEEQPVRFVTIDSRRQESDILKYRYSILVKQFTINSEDYNYYSRLKSLGDDVGSLFDKQLGELKGNLSNMNSPDEIVLGNFEVSGVSYSRVFFSPSDFSPPFEIPDFRYDCSSDDINYTSVDSISYYLNFGSYRIIDINPFPPPGEENEAVRYANQTCTDCTWYATNKKPDFWIDE